MITIFGGLILGLFLAEIGLRIVGYSSPDFFAPDDTLGYSLEPNLSGYYRREGDGFVTINSDGFRDVMHEARKPSDVYRIAMLGDSFLEGMQVNESDLLVNYVRDSVER